MLYRPGCPYLEKDKKILEKVQARATKLISSIQHLSLWTETSQTKTNYTGEKKGKRRLASNILMTQIDKTKPVHYFQFANYDRTRGHTMKLAKTRSRLDIRNFFYSQRVVDKWNKLPQSAIDCTHTPQLQIKNWQIWVFKWAPRVPPKPCHTKLSTCTWSTWQRWRGVAFKVYSRYIKSTLYFLFSHCRSIYWAADGDSIPVRRTPDWFQEIPPSRRWW